MRVRVLAAIAVVALGWAVWPHATAARLQVFAGSDVQLRIVGVKTLAEVPALSPEAGAALYSEMSSAPYFAAFAVGPEGRFGWVGKRHDIATARRGALSRCGSDCTVIIEHYPANYTEPQDALRSVSVHVADRIAQRDDLNAGRSVYYALAGNGSWALQNTKESGPWAGYQVYRRCQVFLHETQPQADCTLFYGPVAVMPAP